MISVSVGKGRETYSTVVAVWGRLSLQSPVPQNRYPSLGEVREEEVGLGQRALQQGPG